MRAARLYAHARGIFAFENEGANKKGGATALQESPPCIVAPPLCLAPLPGVVIAPYCRQKLEQGVFDFG